MTTIAQVLRRGPWPGYDGDYANLSCGHQVLLAHGFPQSDELHCGECADDVERERDALRDALGRIARTADRELKRTERGAAVRLPRTTLALIADTAEKALRRGAVA